MWLAVCYAHAVVNMVPPMCAPAPQPRCTAALMRPQQTEKKKLRKQIGEYLRKLKEIDAYGDTPCDDGCDEALLQLGLMRDEGLPLHVHVHTKVMISCAHRLQVVQGLFAELQAGGVENEASYAALLRAQVHSGDRAAAAATLHQLLKDGTYPVKLRTCAPLLLAACEAGDHLRAMRIWASVQQRGVIFTPREYGAMLRMLGRAGAGRQLWRLLGKLLGEHPTVSESQDSIPIQPHTNPIAPWAALESTRCVLACVLASPAYQMTNRPLASAGQ